MKKIHDLTQNVDLEEVSFEGVADRWVMQTLRKEIVCSSADCFRKDGTILPDYARAVEINPKLHDQDGVLIRMIREKWANHQPS